MKIEKIIKDVIEDYNRNSESPLNSEQISKVLVNSMRAIETKLKEGEVYAVCMQCIYYLLENEVIIDTPWECYVEECDVEKFVEKFFLQDMTDILAYSEPFEWIPEPLEKVLKMGYTIFEAAKDAYYMFGAGVGSANVDNLYSQMIDARNELDSLEYIYRNYNEILAIYEQELSESQLDIDTIKGEKLMLSLRMAEYIENNVIDIVNEDVDFSIEHLFSIENPFSMLDDLFQ